jgi:hypothetical protein
MPDIQKYQKMEAIEELLDDYDVMIANLDAAMTLIDQRTRTLRSRLRVRKPANVKLTGYMRLIEFRKAFHLSEIKKITIEHYQDGLNEKMKDLRGKR